ncbi:hypothetical protein LTR10_022619 [Elasticomyces elasticus]|uniref:Carboxylic ester hydrolase n=1 Tax=Exophiala sideris TaxID=1016849 RepID=A0ABR0JAA4_9EURO|nr:hypothetical protein LTR10_022619 [Elasticomyces elasticus]KAK5026148.1 hypothetical protein LTS07_007673 [Exophiala sideris]KAK5032402.1 hypothetical protein LTR13_007225 [Exophiala sideris]KAK5059558.1 hypothetical protein LTR69_006147 [Exophiala sideris]KAK5178159.1 hypothetical protein LTR44_009465 [Eurotiomycetes sp. CCFEE 6388]
MVDLGYEVHQAISFNETGQLYSFSNIRFAQPPIGDLRFAAPVPPTGRDPVAQNGSVGRICPQAVPNWSPIASELEAYIIAGNVSSFNYTALNQQLQLALQNAPPTPQTDGRATEDCLFLDVIVPKAVFDKRNSRLRRWQNGGAPVVIWVYGGGYTLGSKEQWGNPSGLIKASQTGGSDGIIYVTFNYRLGALGWLAGPTFQASGGTSNAGLYDQRLAFQWVAQYIHLFGGDPNQVTILGESAGGGSIVHQITAYGGQQPVPFQRAISQSPGFQPIASQYSEENTTNTFFSVLDVSTLAEARAKSSDEVILANTIQVGFSYYGGFTYGPVVDGTFVPQLPGILLGSGRFAKNITVMVGHNIAESPGFTPPYLETEADFESWLQSTLPGISQAALDYILNVLYPAVYDGSEFYTTPLERAFLMVQEAIFACNTYYLNTAFNNQTYAYEFQVPPGFHGEDIPYTYYNGEGSDPTQDLIAPVAEELQGYLVNFAMTGNPNAPDLPYFPMYGANASINAINATYTKQQVDDVANQRCAWFQKGLFG